MQIFLPLSMASAYRGRSVYMEILGQAWVDINNLADNENALLMQFDND